MTARTGRHKPARPDLSEIEEQVNEVPGLVQRINKTDADVRDLENRVLELERTVAELLQP